VNSIIELFHVFRDSLYQVLKFFQDLVEPLLGSQSYWFSIVMLTIAVRVILIPLTVKQVRSTRAMQELQPELKKLQTKYKNDRQKLNEEMMALYRERGFNPMAGCWPLLAQMPFFFALYHVIYSDIIAGEPNILSRATFFGIPLSEQWTRLPTWADKLASPDGLVILVLIIAMSATTYISQRQLLARQGSQVNPQQQMLMRILPLTFLIFAVNVPLAIIIYWVTTNLWSMGQQYFLLKNAPTPAGAGAAAGSGAGAPVPAPAVVDNGTGRKGLGPFGLFRSLLQQSPEPPSTNGGGARTAEGKPGSKQPGNRQSGNRQSGNRQSGNRQSGSKQPGNRQSGNRQTQKGGPGGAAAGGKRPQAGNPPKPDEGGTQKGGQAQVKPSQPGQPGATGRKPAAGSGGRRTGKGKPSGQRRSKR
jgi:YidC/Oxa1 family membrane protein insertase